jgi:hypothetical protein
MKGLMKREKEETVGKRSLLKKSYSSVNENKWCLSFHIAQSETRPEDDGNLQASGRIQCNSNAVAPSTSLSLDCIV